LEETNESLISHRLNDILRVLTAISVVILPLTLIASVMGMNTWVPSEGHEAGFITVLGLMAIILVAMVAYFRRRKWL
ncbi:MAG TPA: CorA family divalent cation transporter, partial [Solirubrobacterales bacterium]|nr:CorA family divalent cation transporter [Solirubrobacterales bacterium]